jgi:tripartite-type tricarboxylate transporter receptor subunit TctC
MRKRMVISAAVLMALSGVAGAQEWPTRPMTLIVPFVAGGAIDAVARLQSQRLGEVLGQSVIIENVGGGGGSIGAQRVAKAAPDGYQYVVGNIGTHAYNQTLYKRPLYNALTDFAPVGLATGSPRLLVVRKDLPVNNLQDFVAYTKANHARMQFGSGGVGSATHIPCVLLNMAIGVEVQHIPYRGIAPSLQDLIGGRIDYISDSIQTSSPQVLENNIKAIAILAPTRSPVLPDVPTAAEQGLNGVDANAWNGFFLPKGTPDEIVRKLNTAVGRTLDDPVVRERMAAVGLSIVPPEQRSPEYLAKFVASEIERWAVPIKASGATID